jgi:hypothetical protein
MGIESIQMARTIAEGPAPVNDPLTGVNISAFKALKILKSSTLNAGSGVESPRFLQPEILVIAIRRWGS